MLYHNRTGSMDPAESEELAIPEEQFWQLEAALESRVRKIALTPFSQYAPALRENGSDTSFILVMDIKCKWKSETRTLAADRRKSPCKVG
ncbi:MAG TPA: hypothetical protein PLA31_11110 [Clostridia bacterium]|nr:hypothetical protein [Clostridia bacterium]HUM61973.1 hypothetical protein [Clostridia bacterium]